MKTLIVYYSFTGNNKALAEKLYEPLQYDILRIEEESRRSVFSIFLNLMFKRLPRLKKYDVDISTYENVVLIAPVWAGKVAAPMESFIRREKLNLTTYSFITLCGGVEGQKEKLRASLSVLIGKQPVAVEELWVSDLLSDQEKALKHVGAYQIKETDWGRFDKKITAFQNAANFSKMGSIYA